jgi:hypothetical protein
VHTGLAVITGTEDRQHAYVALTRGTDANLAHVFTASPRTADPAPGPEPAPELARYDKISAERSGHHEAAAGYHALAASYKAMQDAYRKRENVFAGVMTDRADWEAATRAQRHLAVAADAELRRRHPEQRFAPLRSAEPHPATAAQRAELILTAGQDIPEPGQWIKELSAQRRTFAERLADRQSWSSRPKTPATAPSAGCSRPGPDCRRARFCSRRNRRSVPRPGSWSASWTATPTWKPGNDGLGRLGDSLSSPRNLPGRTRVFSQHVYGYYPQTFLYTADQRARAVACSCSENCLR